MIAPSHRVAVTGIGVVAPNGIGLERFWQSILAAESSVHAITLFDAQDQKGRVAGEVQGFDASKHIKFQIKPKRLARHTQFALAALHLALSDAQALDASQRRVPTLPVILGVSSSAFDLIEAGMTQMQGRGPGGVSPFVVASSPPQAVTSAIAEALRVAVEGETISTGCPAGLDAIASGAERIRADRVDMVIAGGTDAPITPLAFATFSAARLASARNEEPEKASRPFDADRDSGVVSEGACIVILENLDVAIARGVQPYLEVTGYHTAIDVDFERPASGLAETMRMALANAGKRTEDVDYICAHGPGHPVLDLVETEAIKKTFGDRAYRIPVSSIKGVVGNPLSATGPLQLAATAMAFREGLLPPTANYEHPDPACDLDYVPQTPRRAHLDCALINTHGIGGVNSTLVVERTDLRCR